MRSRLALALVLAAAAPAGPERMVFLGDSITDGHTAPLLVEQALGDPHWTCINAGVAGDTTSAMRRRLERDVLPRHPTLVSLSAGINDVLRGVTAAEYESEVSAISDRLKREGIPMILLTPTILGPKHRQADPTLDAYVEGLRRIAAREGYPVAEVRSRMTEARAAGLELLEPDQVHLTFQGYRVMVRAILDALGRSGTPVPQALTLGPMPGLIRSWKLRAMPQGEWKPLELPLARKPAHWWLDQERQRGFAVELAALAGPSTRYQAVASMESEKPREVFFNTGAELAVLRLNGSVLWLSEGWTGWHAGKERIAARLEAGTNAIEVESGASFFLSITDANSW